MKVFSFLLSLMVFFINPVGATSGKDSGGTSQQHIHAVAQKLSDSNSGDAKQNSQVQDQVTHEQSKADNSAKQ